MTIFSQGNTKEYLAHIITVLHLINQKGLNVQCRKLAKTVDKLVGTLDNLQKSIGPKGSKSNEDQEASKLELSQTQEMLKDTQKGSQQGRGQDVQACEEPPVR